MGFFLIKLLLIFKKEMKGFIMLKIIGTILILTSHAFAQDFPTTPVQGPEESIGGYSSGCFIGGEKMHFHEDGLHQMRLKRNRLYGLPILINYLRTSAKLIKETIGRDILLSDLCQGRGGPLKNSAHVSHTNGLDIDIWFRSIKSQEQPLSASARERMGAYSVLKTKTSINPSLWTEDDRKVAEILASDTRVHRIFVNPVVKKDLCENGNLPVYLMRKFRPWYGHHDHYHVRLKCPVGSPDCTPQANPPEGDGCGEELDWWMEQMRSPKEPSGPDPRTPEQRWQARLDKLHPRCKELLGLDP